MLKTLDLQPRVIATPADLDALLSDLARQVAIAVDTEANSLYAYQERVCLIQFSTPDADYVVDPLAGLDLRPLGEIFANPHIEKVFHAASYDILCLKRDFGFQFAHLFDTMLAARMLGWRSVGLGALLQDIFGVYTDKRYQRYNWGKRPLPLHALQYASTDTHFLLPLHAAQREALHQSGRWERAQAAFARLTELDPPSRNSSSQQGVWHIREFWGMDRVEQTVLQELYHWRELEAQRLNQPPFRVLSTRALVLLARSRPHTARELRRIVGQERAHRYNEALLRAIRNGEQRGTGHES